MTRCALSCKDASPLRACHWAIQCLREDTVGRHDCSPYVRTCLQKNHTYHFAKSYFKLHYTKLVCTKFHFLPSIFWLIRQSLVSFLRSLITHTHTLTFNTYIFTAGGSQTLYILAKTHMVIFKKKKLSANETRGDVINKTFSFIQ